MLAYMLANSLISRMVLGPSYDPDATAYLAAVETAKGSPASQTQADAVNTFIVAEKVAGRWDGLKRLFFPIWANASANAIDMKTLAVGTWINSSTHSAGYVTGNGTSSYFDMGAAPSALGMTVSSGVFGHLSPGGGSGTAVTNMGCSGADIAISSMVERWINTLGIDMFYCDIGTGLLRQGASLISSNYGIVICRRNAGVREIARRASGGISVLATATNGDAGIIPVQNVWAMAVNMNGTPFGGFSNLQYGAWFLALGLDSSNRDAFTDNLKTLWETATGLSLPA